MQWWPDPEGVTGPSHPLIVKFREVRSQEPEPDGQHIDLLKSPPGFKLKVGRWRGATWYDGEAEAVFLIAAGWREHGDPEDFYKELERLRDGGSLFPSDADYDELAIWRSGRWLRQLRDEAGPKILAEAIAEPEVPRELDLGRCISIVVAYPVNGSHILAIRLDQPREGEFLTPQQALVVAQALAEHKGAEVSPSHLWNGQALSYDSYAFDLIVTNQAT